MKSTLIAALLAGALASGAAAAANTSAPAGADAIRSSVESLNARSSLESVRPSPVTGLKEVRADGQILYFTDDGEYMLVGDIYRVKDRSNITELARATGRADLLATSDPATHISYGDKDAKDVIYVFTDTSCGFCQRFHQEVKLLNEAGVRVEYLGFPRGGARSPELAAMEAAWCSQDRNAAYDSVIRGESVKAAPCSTPILAQHALGERLGVQGTPAIYTADGRQIGGYVPAATILKALSKPE